MARYADAIHWMVVNDDTDWLDDPHGCLSVTAAMAADLFDKSDEQVTADLRKAKAKANRLTMPQVRP